MKNRMIFVSTIVLVLLLIGGTSMAWFVSNPSKVDNEFTAGTIKVKVVEEGFEDLENVEATSYNKNVQVQSLGSKRTYVRLRLIPQWSDPSLPVSNVQLNLANNGDWMDNTASDGYYYFKYYLTQGQTTSLLLASVTFTELGPEYEGETFTLKVVAEGVQITNDMWKEKWNLGSLPFTAEQSWN